MPTANGNLGADSIATMYAHELVEVVTNYLGAWYFDAGSVSDSGSALESYENADACVWDFGTYTGNSNVVFGDKKFLIQQNWVPYYGCRMSL